ncbi:protease complex subunit PrcB family protein [Cyclonatronum proteinivorum]|nr:protease complex subunit PrcB family protein [Cyclonatronum proteinivorum]
MSEPLTLAKGNYAPYQPAGEEPLYQLVITSQEAYDEFRLKFEEGGFGESLPEVDFDRHMVVGVWMGESNSSGFDTEIVGFDTTDSEFNIWVRNKYPDPSCAYLTVITTPFHIVALPKTELPITFMSNRVMDSCD